MSYLFISHDLGVVRYISDRIAVLYLGRVQELGPADVVFDGPHHPYTEALLSAVPTIDGGGRHRIRLQGDIPSAAEPPSGCVFHTRCPRKVGPICEEVEPPLVEVEAEPRDALSHPDRGAARAPGRTRSPREDPRCRARGDGRDARRRRARPRAPRSRGGAGATPRERGLPLGLQRDRRHRRDPLPRRARSRGRRRRRGRRPRRDPRRPRRPCRALLGAFVRGVRGVPARPAVALLDGVAGDGHRRPDGRDPTALARRGAGLPLLVPLDVRRGVRRPRAVVRADRPRHPVRDRRPRRLRGVDGGRRRLAHGRRPTRRSGRRDRLRWGRAVGAAGGGCRRRRSRGRGRRRAAEAGRRESVRGDGHRRLAGERRGHGGSDRRGAPVAESTTRSRRREDRKPPLPPSSRRVRAAQRC